MLYIWRKKKKKKKSRRKKVKVKRNKRSYSCVLNVDMFSVCFLSFSFAVYLCTRKAHIEICCVYLDSVCVCMCVCMSACVHACIHDCVSVCVYTGMCICVQSFLQRWREKSRGWRKPCFRTAMWTTQVSKAIVLRTSSLFSQMV